MELLRVGTISGAFEIGRKAALDFLEKKVQKSARLVKFATSFGGGFAAAIAGYFGFEAGSIFCEIWLDGMEEFDRY